MQKWEYTVFEWQRDLTSGFSVNGKEWQTNFGFKQLGDAGWELVSAFPVSSRGTQMSAGVTTSITFIFKRPIPNA